MTPKSVIVVDAKEIKSIDIRCECGMSLTIPMVTKKELPHDFKCDGCGNQLWVNTSALQAGVFQLIEALRDISKDTGKTCSVTFTLACSSKSDAKGA